tara:strand:+ start:89 stop:544 length:456 start_codon:yes stop_codon:yes gene_type:complete
MGNKSKPKPKSILSLDIGKKRIGIAGCDPLGITIKRLPAIHRECFKEDLEKLNSLCIQRDVKGLIIGIPLDNRGNPTQQSEYCYKYGKEIALALNLPIAWVNEQCTSWEAGNLYNLKGDRTGLLDSAAACLLVQQWLREGPELKPVDMASY